MQDPSDAAPQTPIRAIRVPVPNRTEPTIKNGSNPGGKVKKIFLEF